MKRPLLTGVQALWVEFRKFFARDSRGLGLQAKVTEGSTLGVLGL